MFRAVLSGGEWKRGEEERSGGIGEIVVLWRTCHARSRVRSGNQIYRKKTPLGKITDHLGVLVNLST